MCHQPAFIGHRNRDRPNEIVIDSPSTQRCAVASTGRTAAKAREVTHLARLSHGHSAGSVQNPVKAS